MPADPDVAALLHSAWAALGGDAELLGELRLAGRPEGLLASTLAAMPAMTAAVAASALAAAALDRARGARPPVPVVVDRDHVAVAARSERYARRAGRGPQDLFAPLSRFWETADGWLRLHANYPWHRERALAVLGCDDQPDAVAAAVRRWRGAPLEDALAGAGALGYAVRTRQEWGDHPQGRAVAAQPLVHLTPVPGPGRPAIPGRGAAGTRVLDLTRVIAGPVATRTLAAWGAKVLRIDSPELPELPSQTQDTLSGKRSASLDLRDPAARTVMEELLASADVLVQGYRPGALARFGLDGQDLALRHPHLSVVTLSAWGPAGPWSRRRGFDSLVQCPTGIAAAEGRNGRPGALPAQVLDHATGYLAAAGALLALASVQQGGPTRHVQLSLAQTAHWLLGAGTTARQAARDPDPVPFEVLLPGAAEPVRVISPPGRVGDLVPTWSFTSDLRAHQPAFW